MFEPFRREPVHAFQSLYARCRGACNNNGLGRKPGLYAVIRFVCITCHSVDKPAARRVFIDVFARLYDIAVVEVRSIYSRVSTEVEEIMPERFSCIRKAIKTAHDTAVYRHTRDIPDIYRVSPVRDNSVLSAAKLGVILRIFAVYISFIRPCVLSQCRVAVFQHERRAVLKS